MNDTLILSTPTADLVFGLEWFALIGGRPDRLARRIARQRRASHMVLAGETAAAVGVGVLGKTGRSRKPLHSAAQNLALLFGTGTTAVLVDLGEGRHWLAAVHEGAVVAGTDRLYASPRDAARILQELRQAYPQIRVLGRAPAPEPPALDALEGACAPASRLSALRAWRSRLPRPVQVSALAVLAALLLPHVRHALHRPASQAPGAGHAAAQPPHVWRDAIAQAMGAHVVHGISGTRALLEVFHQLPVDIGGWRLQQAECEGQGAAWRCRARYQRAARAASNAGFLAGAPKEWALEFATLEQAEGNWVTAPHGAPLARQRLASSAVTENRLFSALQDLRPAFSHIHIGKPAPLLAALPKDRGPGQARPPGLAMPLRRPIQISGPLRSASLLPPVAASIFWNRALLALGDLAKPALASSRLTLTLQGVLYEMETQSIESGERAVADSGIQGEAGVVQGAQNPADAS